MTHNDWQAAVTAALALAEHDTKAAARAFERLAARSARHAKSAVGDWHFEQTLGLAAATLDEAGHHEAAARLYRRLARHHQRVLTYQRHALAWAQTAEALALFAIGRRTNAVRVAGEALKAGIPSAMSEELIRKVRAALEARARTKKKTQAKGSKRGPRTRASNQSSARRR